MTLIRTAHTLLTIMLLAPAAHAQEVVSRLIDHRTIVDPSETISLTVGGVEFTVPVNRLDTFIEPDRYLPDEVASGFTITGLWPTFEMRSHDNVDEFSGQRSDNPYEMVVSAWVTRVCPTSEISVPTESCDLEHQYKTLYRVFGGEEFHTSSDAGEHNLRPPGLTFAGVSNTPGLAQEISEQSHSVYVVNANEPQREFISCAVDRPGTRYFPRCEHFAPWRDGLLVRIVYDAGHLEDWMKIRDRVLSEFDDFAD